MMLEQTDPKQDAKRFVDGMAELRRQTELRRLEEAAKQFLRDTGVGPIADHMSVHAWMAAFAYTQVHQALNDRTESTGTATKPNLYGPLEWEFRKVRKMVEDAIPAHHRTGPAGVVYAAMVAAMDEVLAGHDSKNQPLDAKIGEDLKDAAAEFYRRRFPNFPTGDDYPAQVFAEFAAEQLAARSVDTIRAFMLDVIELSDERYAKREEDLDEGYFDRWAMHQVLERVKVGQIVSHQEAKK